MKFSSPSGASAQPVLVLRQTAATVAVWRGVVLSAALLLAFAPAQAIYKCKSATGMIYSDAPCPADATDLTPARAAPGSANNAPAKATAPSSGDSADVLSGSDGKPSAKAAPPVPGALGATPADAVRNTFQTKGLTSSGSVKTAIDEFLNTPRMKVVLNGDDAFKAELNDAIAKSIKADTLVTGDATFDEPKQTAWLPWSVTFDSARYAAVFAKRRQALKAHAEIRDDVDALSTLPTTGTGEIKLTGVAQTKAEATQWRATTLSAPAGTYPATVSECKGVGCNLGKSGEIIGKEWSKFKQQLGIKQ